MRLKASGPNRMHHQIYKQFDTRSDNLWQFRREDEWRSSYHTSRMYDLFIEICELSCRDLASSDSFVQSASISSILYCRYSCRNGHFGKLGKMLQLIFDNNVYILDFSTHANLLFLLWNIEYHWQVNTNNTKKKHNWRLDTTIHVQICMNKKKSRTKHFVDLSFSIYSFSAICTRCTHNGRVNATLNNATTNYIETKCVTCSNFEHRSNRSQRMTE